MREMLTECLQKFQNHPSNLIDKNDGNLSKY